MNCQWEYIVVFILIYEMTFITFHKTSIDSFMLFFSYNANNSLNKTYTFRLKMMQANNVHFRELLEWKKQILSGIILLICWSSVTIDIRPSLRL